MASLARIPLFSAVLAAVIFCSLCEAAPLYRWVDEDGRVHYADKIPPQHSKSRRARLNDRGLSLDVLEKNKSREELDREKKLMELRSAAQRLLQEQLARDRALLRSFRSEAEIGDAFRGKLTILENLQTAKRKHLANLESQLKAEQKRAADFETTGNAIPEPVVKNILAYRDQIASGQQKIRDVESQKLDLRKNHETDLKRFRALTAGTSSSPGMPGSQPFSSATRPAGPVILGVADCPGESLCAKAWELARDYLVQHSGTGIRIDTDLVIDTAAPENDDEIALSLARIRDKESSGAQLFLDFRCKQTRTGQEACSGEQVREILAGFRPYVANGLGSRME